MPSACARPAVLLGCCPAVRAMGSAQIAADVAVSERTFSFDPPIMPLGNVNSVQQE